MFWSKIQHFLSRFVHGGDESAGIECNDTGRNILQNNFHVLPSLFYLNILFSKQASRKLKLIPSNAQIPRHFIKRIDETSDFIVSRHRDIDT